MSLPSYCKCRTCLDKGHCDDCTTCDICFVQTHCHDDSDDNLNEDNIQK